MIRDLNRRFRVDVVKSPSTKTEIEELSKFSPIPVPNFYLEIISSGSEFEILVDGEMYIRFWGASGCVEMNVAYEIQKNLGPCLAVGDDEGGKAFILMPETPKFRRGLYLSSFGCLDLEYSKYIADSLEDLLINGQGAERIYE